MSKVWFITGATRGLGADFARAALNAGYQVVATGRRAEAVTEALGSSENLLPVALDVTNENQIKAAIKSTIDRFGQIDVLVNNAGYGQLGPFEETSLADVRSQFETNVFGLMAVTHAVIPSMRERHSGRIFNISSVSGLKGVWGASIYCASKFAVEGFSQSIAEELAPFDVYVTAVSPGFFRTDFLDPKSVTFSGGEIDGYAERMKEFLAFHDERNHTQAGDPAKLAQVLLKLAEVEKPPVSFLAGSDAVEWVQKSINEQNPQIDTWRELSVSTDGDWSSKEPVGTKK